MIILICGSRNWRDRKTIEDILSLYPKDSTIIQGGCRGADQIAAQVAISLGFREIKTYLADWQQYGKAAGPIRNKEMLDKNPGIELVIAFHDNIETSRGTKNMLAQAQERKIPWIIYRSVQEKK